MFKPVRVVATIIFLASIVLVFVGAFVIKIPVSTYKYASLQVTPLINVNCLCYKVLCISMSLVPSILPFRVLTSPLQSSLSSNTWRTSGTPCRISLTPAPQSPKPSVSVNLVDVYLRLPQQKKSMGYSWPYTLYIIDFRSSISFRGLLISMFI